MNNERKPRLDSAFPVSDTNTALAMFNAGIDPTGMSKRFYAACAAMQGLLSNPNLDEWTIHWDNVPEKLAQSAYQYADELLKAEQL